MEKPSSKLSLKLVIDKKTNSLLFAEARKEVVDFICSILTLPVGTVTKLLSEQGMVGCLPSLYQSIDNLDNDYLQSNQHKNTVLKPTVYNSTEESPLFLLTNLPNKNKEIPKLYMCTSTSNSKLSHFYVTNEPGKMCHYCCQYMSTPVTFIEGNTGAQTAVPVSSKCGFVKGVVTYMVMDDLADSPTSAIAGLSFLSKLNVDVKSIEEKVVDLDMAKGLKMLKASFQTMNVLTQVFLKDEDNMENKKPCRLA